MLALGSAVSDVAPLAHRYTTQLERLGIKTVRDLLWHLPVRYEDFSKTRTIDSLEKGEEVVVIARVVSIAARRGWRSKKNITEAILEDDTGQMRAVWFNQPYLTKVLNQGSEYYFSGKVIDFYGITLSNPTHERFDGESKALHFGNLTPIYPSTQRMTQKLLRYFVASALRKSPHIVEHLPAEYREEQQMLSLPQAVREIHFPHSIELQEKAVYRLKFEELWQVQQRSKELRQRLEKFASFSLDHNPDTVAEWISSLPFALTKSQIKALAEIKHGIKQTHPMIRLLQGEVGSGKTIVAAAALYQAVLSKAQGAILAPTEVLALQHFETLRKLFHDCNINVALYTRTSKVIAHEGAVSISSRDAMKKGMRAGTIDIVIGTHALLQKGISFHKLGLLVIDEQQRFGVKQRLEIVKKNKDSTLPHMLALTATPIPRTYTHFLYGALDVSIIDEVPQGRKKVITKLIKRSDVTPVFDLINEELAKGQQAYVICPVIMESDSLGVEAVTSEEEKLKKIFPKRAIAALHGRMTGAAKEQVMRDFLDAKIDILISTAVVEVGIDVPNATVMFIESPERFGLAQLHQFRGRVGRGAHQSYCYIVAEDEIAEANKRLKLFTKIDNGFELSEKDLSLRGPGEVYGIAQSGFTQFKIATLADVAIMKEVKTYLELNR